MESPEPLLYRWEELATLLQQQIWSQIALVTDTHTQQHCLPILHANLSLDLDLRHINLPPGEANKSLAQCAHIWSQLTSFGMDRHGLLLCLGGGMITDIGGFCAAAYMRGISFVHLPTSLLGLVDASIGGKTAINLHHLKNAIGFFQKPTAVFVEPIFLQTLPEREWNSGFAEVIKYGLLKGGTLWEKIAAVDQLIHTDLTHIISACIMYKQKVVQVDPYDKSVRKKLNLGHTVGHALEGASQLTAHPLLHGEAVAYGLLIEAWVAAQQHLLSISDFEAILQVIKRWYRAYPVELLPVERLKWALLRDKKNQAGQVSCILLHAIGQAHIHPVVSVKTLLRAIPEAMKLLK